MQSDEGKRPLVRRDVDSKILLKMDRLIKEMGYLLMDWI
jgi:hypothetical protein